MAFEYVKIPAWVLKRDDIGGNEKIILGYMLGFNGNFRASNRHMAECAGLTEGTIENILTKLRSKGLVRGRTPLGDGVDPTREWTDRKEDSKDRKERTPLGSEVPKSGQIVKTPPRLTIAALSELLTPTQMLGRTTLLSAAHVCVRGEFPSAALCGIQCAGWAGGPEEICPTCQNMLDGNQS